MMESMARQQLIDNSAFRTGFYTKSINGILYWRMNLLYGVWSRIRRDCGLIARDYMAKNDRHYNYYGRRGIKVCDEWAKSYKAFRRWALLHGFKHGLSIDRIDRNCNYEPSNCQWITLSENSRKANYYRWWQKRAEALINDTAFAQIGR